MKYFQFSLRTFLIFCILVHVSFASKILFFIGLGTHSHRVAMQPLASKLADRGHEISFLSTIKPEKLNPKIKEVKLRSAYETLKTHNCDVMDYILERRINDKYYDYLFEGTNLWDLFFTQYDAFLNNKEFQKFIGDSQFDLIITDYNIKEVAHVMGHVMGAKVIWFYTAGAPFQLDFELLALPIESSWLPDLTLGSAYFWIPNHFVYAFNSLSWYLSFYWYFLPKVNQLVENSLGKGIPSMDELYPNVDLVFLNEHFSYGYPRSLPPFLITVGGMHCKDSTSTLEQLKSAPAQKILEFISPYEEFVYISLGSFINTEKLPKKFQDILFGTLAKLDRTAFLLKWQGAIPEILSSNVLAMEWFPQQELLGHSKCRGFVTQGGAMSFQQAVHYEVPLIIIPAWWDQSNIGRRSAELGIGVHLEFPEVTQESLSQALNQILRNKTYCQNMRTISARSKDRPMEAEETAVWWTEYVLQHNTSHLKSPAMKQRWWQRRLLDFWFAMCILLTTVSFISAKILLVFFNGFFKRYVSIKK